MQLSLLPSHAMSENGGIYQLFLNGEHAGNLALYGEDRDFFKRLVEISHEPYHLLDLSGDGWTLEHPLDCRLADRPLSSCPFVQLLAADTGWLYDTYGPDRPEDHALLRLDIDRNALVVVDDA